MSSNYHLQQVQNQWRFQDESVLEEFIWTHLESLFGYKPLKRQHHVSGNYCDILAVDNNRGLVIIELKNTEDRYVIQQLTRYYDAHVQAKCFSSEVDYRRTIKLIVIAPTIHRDNRIDRRYSTLDYQLIKYGVGEQDSIFYFHLKDLTHGDCYPSITIPHTSDPEQSVKIASPPKRILNAIARSKQVGTDRFFSIRELLLTSDPKMKELSNGQSVIYGSTKSRVCAEFTVKKQYSGSSRDVPYFYLWLPIVSRGRHSDKRFSRMRFSPNLFSPDLSKQDFMAVRVEQRGIGRTKRSAIQSWAMKWYLLRLLEIELDKEIKERGLEGAVKTFCKTRSYVNPISEPSRGLEFFSNVAIDMWKIRSR